MTPTSPRRRWTDEQRLEAIALAAEHGRAHASRQTGIPDGTIASWMQRAGIIAADPAGKRQDIEVARLVWTERRALLGDRCAVVADKGLTRLIDRIEHDDKLAAAELLTLIERLIEKARSLNGDGAPVEVGEGGPVVSKDRMLAEAQQRAQHLVAVPSS